MKNDMLQGCEWWFDNNNDLEVDKLTVLMRAQLALSLDGVSRSPEYVALFRKDSDTHPHNTAVFQDLYNKWLISYEVITDIFLRQMRTVLAASSNETLGFQLGWQCGQAVKQVLEEMGIKPEKW